MANAERTEKATPKKRDEARNKGQVARSRDVVQVAVMGATVYMLTRWGGQIITLLEGELTRALAESGAAATQTIGSGDVIRLVEVGGQLVAMTAGPIALASVAAVFAASILQTGWLVTSESLTIDWNRLNPAKGLERIVKVGPYDLLKMLVVATALGYVAFRATQDVVVDAPRLSRLRLATGVMTAWTVIDHFLRQALIVLVVVAATDYGFQRYRHSTGLRMSKQEVKEEERQRDGNPQIKGRVRRVQREIARRRMLAATKRATVVVTNPTHYAVALEYRRESMAAPRVVAKGRGFLAQRIKDIAREAGVPIVEQVALARALYKSAEIGDTIPADLFEAVAEMLAYLIRLKQLVL